MEGRDLVCAIKGHYICEAWDQCKLTMEQQMKQDNHCGGCGRELKLAIVAGDCEWVLK